VFLGVLFHVACDLVDHFFLYPEMVLAFRVKYLFIPFIPKLARGEVYVLGEETAVRPRYEGHPDQIPWRKAEKAPAIRRKLR
jgi:hypothetical protein